MAQRNTAPADTALGRDPARAQRRRHVGRDALRRDGAARSTRSIADGVKSTESTLLTVVDVPYVQKLDLEYHYPAYTGLEPEKIEDGGDIAVLRGTEVRVHITPTMKTPGGQIAVNDKQIVPLTLQPDGTLTAAFKADADGFYRVELQTPAKRERRGVAAVHDRHARRPRADGLVQASPDATPPCRRSKSCSSRRNAEDDYGIRDLELVYSVNGGAEKVVKLFKGDAARCRNSRRPHVLSGRAERAAGRLGVVLRARDGQRRRGRRQAGDERPLFPARPAVQKDFRQAPSQGGGGGGGGGGGQQHQVEALSEQQRQIISATFNVNREKKTLTPQKLRENSKVVELAQSKLREQVEGLLTRMNSELVQRDPAFAKIAEMLPQAVTAMKEAEGQLAAAKPDVAHHAREQGAADSAEGRGRVRDADQRPARPAGWRRRRWRRRRDAAGARRSCSSRTSTSWPAATRAPRRRPSSRPIARSTSCSRS